MPLSQEIGKPLTRPGISTREDYSEDHHGSFDRTPLRCLKRQSLAPQRYQCMNTKGELNKTSLTQLQTFFIESLIGH